MANGYILANKSRQGAQSWGTLLNSASRGRTSVTNASRSRGNFGDDVEVSGWFTVVINDDNTSITVIDNNNPDDTTFCGAVGFYSGTYDIPQIEYDVEWGMMTSGYIYFDWDTCWYDSWMLPSVKFAPTLDEMNLTSSTKFILAYIEGVVDEELSATVISSVEQIWIGGEIYLGDAFPRTSFLVAYDGGGGIFLADNITGSIDSVNAGTAVINATQFSVGTATESAAACIYLQFEYDDVSMSISSPVLKAEATFPDYLIVSESLNLPLATTTSEVNYLGNTVYKVTQLWYGNIFQGTLYGNCTLV